MKLVKQVFDIGYFARALQVRFGELSRAPLCLTRLELKNEIAECEWIARPADQWDRDISRQVSDGNVSIQSLRDAIAIRDLLFYAIPGIDAALLRVFRQSVSGDLELIITGTVAREQQATRNISSLVMRAKLLGLQFWIEDGILEPLRSEEFAMSF